MPPNSNLYIIFFSVSGGDFCLKLRLRKELKPFNICVNRLCKNIRYEKEHGKLKTIQTLGRSLITRMLNSKLANHNLKIEPQRIDNPSIALMSLTKLKNKKLKPKARALESTPATTAGTSYDNVVAQ
ncbi:hypothetical protein BB560_004303, partial [Smittium megazygosporum]